MICVIDSGTIWLKKIVKNIEECGHQVEIIKIKEDLNSVNFSYYSRVIITGASVSLAKDDGHYVNKFEFLKDIKIPVLGICFGHQIIGMVYGGGD